MNITDNKPNQIKSLIERNDLEENFNIGEEFKEINESIASKLDKEFEIPLNINPEKVKAKNFIFTKNAIKKLKEIKYYILNHYPVLLEGPTGTAKTKSVEILCEEMGLKLKRFNLSSETKIADLFGRYAGDPDSFSGISFQEGGFIEAFKNGETLLLDEINLASNQVLQSFEECLDSHRISCEIPGMPWKEIQMGEGFNLIATQNPNRGLFANKRQELGKKFLSRFHIINFDSFEKDELYEIAKGLGEKKNIPLNILKELVIFHEEWSNSEERKNDILCFTIREIEATINAIAKGENIKDAILSIYGSRYKSKELEKLKSNLKNYPLLNSKNKNYNLSFNNEFLYITPPLENLLKAVKLSFDNNRHVMIIGDEGTGKSQIAKYIAEYRDKINEINDIDEGIYYCQCTEDLKCSDLIGNQYPSLNSSKEISQQLMKWEDGFLTLSIIKGKCCVLDNIEEAPATITERLNGLLDKKLDQEKDLIFEIPECPQRKEVIINNKFRLLCICNYNSISKMSPAFLNRFDIITLEDQLKPFYGKESSKELLDLINTLMKQHCFNYHSNIKQNEEYLEKKEKLNKYRRYMDIDDLNLNVEEKKLNFNYIKDDSLNKLILNKISIIMKNNPNDLSMYKLSLFCRAVYIFMQELDPNKEIELDKLVNYAFQLIISPNIEDDQLMEDFIYNKYLNREIEESNDNKYFFQESPKLKSFMAKLLASSIINLHICVIGKTGVGKTSCAREFSRIRKKSMGLTKDFYMHSFHSNTKPSHFYGNITMKNNYIEFVNGSLLNAMEKGTTFIADEMNLSPEIVMKSLVPALDLNLNCKIFIPGIIKKISINQKFFFIACQNDFTTTGRNSLPKLLAKKLKCIPYPEPPKEDIQKICSSINLELYENYDDFKKNELIENGKKIANYMDKLNNLKLSYIPNWSIRDITKVLKRVQFQSLEKNAYKYNNIDFKDNIIFYTLSGIYKKDIKDKTIKENLLNKISNILKEIFLLGDESLKDIKDIFNEEAKIVKEKDENFLRKGKCGISLKYILFRFFDKNNNILRLPSLYNELFQILLAHDEEPILIIGESGYKTYLAQLILHDITPIQLNSETTIGQLLGSTIFLSDSEVKIFYLKQIYNILDLPMIDTEIKMVQNWINHNESNHMQIVKEQEALSKKIDEQIFYKKAIKFRPNIEILKEKLMRNNSEKKKNLTNINLEFKPGLILDSILSGKSLILKYLSNLPTVVLERFNELFSGKHNLTLNEDIHDTFTKEGMKEFSNLGENFRIFATCSLGEQNKLSEAILSRFTIICSDKYKLDEQEDVLESFLLDNRLDFDQNSIDEVIQFYRNINNNSLSQMINALSLSNKSEIFKEDKDKDISRVNILSFILYRITYGLSYKIKSNPESQLYDIETKLKDYLRNFTGKIITGEDVNEEPFDTIKIDDKKFIVSKYNNLQIECGKDEEIINEDMDNLAFTKTFTEMVDYIHLGIATNTPVILEGGTGLGKQTAINYVAYKLNYRIINFIITQSTKIEDLLGRNQIIRKDGQIKIEFCETKVLRALIGKEGDKGGNNIIIVFHNLNKASSALMESLCSIFNKNQLNILRPDGRSEEKSKINLIGIINSQSNIAIKDKLPISLLNCVFYYILPKLNPREIKEIIIKKFTAFKLEDEANDFAESFNKSREFSYIKGNISYFSLNDITKYILFRKNTKNSLEKYIILQILFIYRFIQNDFIKDIMKELGFLSMKVNPIIKNKEDCLSISFSNKDIKNELKISYYGDFVIQKAELESKVNTLNIKQKQCLLFLALSILCKRACIIQGDTASGKTHLVRLFAELVGQKLVVYQINKETGLSMFTGQSTLLEHLEEDEIKTIIKYFDALSKFDIFQSYINNNFYYDSTNTDMIDKKWSVKEFNKLIQKIRDYIQINNELMKEEDYNELKAIANNLEEVIQPYKRFKKHDSMFTKALENGYWVLIDGIETANPVISEKLIRLCDENPELDLSETGENIIFSYKPFHKKIHDNFHLFINYNPFNKFNNNQLSEMFLNKCITFTLAPMDVDIESSAQIVYGFMTNSNNVSEILCRQISSQVALIHQEMNKKIQENQDFFSGGVEFTGRIIKYISEELSKSKDNKDLCDHLVNALNLNYINSINNKNVSSNIQIVKGIIKANLNKNISFETGVKDVYQKYYEIFKILRNIQKVAKEKIKDNDFDFMYLLEQIKKVEISDLNLIEYHIDDTLKMLDEFVGNSIKNKIKYFNYYNLIIIKKLLKNVIDYVNKNSDYSLIGFTLNDEVELTNKLILIKEISQFNLVVELSLLNLTSNFVYLPNELIEYIKSIKKLLETNDIQDLFENLKILKKYLAQEMNLSQLFPFNQILLEKKENNNKRIRMFKMLFLIYKIIENKVNFQFGYQSKSLDFVFKKDENESFHNLNILINLNEDFYFEKGMILESEKKIVGIEKIEEEEMVSFSNWFFIVCSRILDNKIQITDRQKIFDIIDKVNKNNSNEIDLIDKEFENEIKGNKRIYRLSKLLSNNVENSEKNEENLVMKIWYLVLFYDEDIIEEITPFFCLPFEKELLNGIKNIYKCVEMRYIPKVISFTKNFLESKGGSTNSLYGSSKTFLYKIQAGFFDYFFVEDKDKKDLCIEIDKEMKWYQERFYSPFEKFWSNEKSIECLNMQYINLKEYVENVDLAEKYKNKLNELIAKVSKEKFEGNEKNKEKLLKLLQSKINNPTKEVYETCEKNVDNYLKNLKEKLSGNKILFPFKTDENKYKENNEYVICLSILKKYSLHHKKLSNIFQKSKNILSEIFQLDKEIEIISDILGNYALEKGEYIKMYEKKVMGIIRALILYTIIRIGDSKNEIESLFTLFLKLPEIINDQIGGIGINYFEKNDILKWAKTTITTDLEDYLIIPKFEPKDFLYLFLIAYEDEKENKETIIKRNKGFLFKNTRNKEIETILFNSLKAFEHQELEDSEKNEFRKYMEKIGRALLQNILPDKYENDYSKLSYMELILKLEEEKKELKNKIYELKQKNQTYENDEMNREIIKGILNCFTLATTYEQNPSNVNLTYEDIEFFQNKIWSKEIMASYPGMTFWLLNNYSNFYIDLMEKKDFKGCFIKEKNKISFWYFQIRIIGNFRTFEYNCYKQKTIEIKNQIFNVLKQLEDEEENDRLKKKVEEFIKGNIKNLLYEKKPVNINWLNLVINDIPPELKVINKNVRHFYEFFANLLADSRIKNKKIKNEIIIEYIIKVLDLIFKNQIEEFFNKNINSKDEIIMLINKPQDEIIKKIKERKQKLLLEKEIKINASNTFKYFENLKKDAPKIIDNIINLVKKKTIEYHNNYEIVRKWKMQNIINNIDQNLNKAKKELQQCFQVIKNKDLQEQTLLDKNIYILDSFMKNKNYFLFSNEKEILFYTLEIDVILNNKNNYILKIKNKKGNNEIIEFEHNCKKIYLQSSLFHEDDILDFSVYIKIGQNSRKLNIQDKIKIKEYKINSFHPNFNFNENVRKRMIECEEKSLNLNEPKIRFNGEELNPDKLKNFLNRIKNFDCLSLQKIECYNETLKKNIHDVLNTIDELQIYLNLKTIGDKNDPKLIGHIRHLQNYINNCKEYLQNNLHDVIKIISLNEEIEGDKIFFEEHDKKIAEFKEPENDNPIYINNNAYLKYPMISDNNKKITFSSESFEMFLGSYIPSLISSPLIIKLLNIKEDKIKGYIKNCNKIISVDERDNENTLKVYINIQKLKAEKLTRENIKFDLEISRDYYKTALIPFNLSFNLVPLLILFSSLDYKLIYDSEQNEFIINSSIVYANSKIEFSFNYYYSSKIPNQLNNNIVDFDYSLETIDNNNPEKEPEIELEKNKLLLQIPKYEENQNNINFILKIYFTSTFYINIKFNSKIFKFEFNLKCYSYIKKKFTEEDVIKIYISEEQEFFPIYYTLYFKLEQISKNTSRTDYEFKYNLPEDIIKIQENDFDKKRNQKKFIFSIKLIITKKPNEYMHKNYYIEVIGNQVHKRINIKPEIMNKRVNLIKELLDLPKYKYSYKNKEFIQEIEAKNDSIYITPFNYYIPFVSNIYSFLEGREPDPSLTFSILCFSKVSKNFKLKDYNYNNYYYYNNNENLDYEIIGIFNDDYWYPKMEMKTKSKEIYDGFENLKYEYDKIKVAEENINLINSNNSYWHLPKIFQYFYSRNNKEGFFQFFNYLPKSIKKELQNEIDSLKDNSNDIYFPIICNNIIYTLYKLFKDKYLEIKSNCGMYLTKERPPENIMEKIKEKKEEFFKINESEFSGLNSNTMIKENEQEEKKEGYNNYLLDENKDPKIIDDLNQKPLKEENIEMKEIESKEFDLSDISLIELKNPSQFTLNEIIEYYTNCNKIINILYFYIISASKSNKLESLKKAGNYFQKLDSIYTQFKSKDYSFFSIDINELKIGFTNLSQKLQNIGYKLGKENYIEFPKKMTITKINGHWTTEHKTGNIKFGQEEAEIGRMHANKYRNDEYYVNENESEYDFANMNNNPETTNIINGEVNIENIKILDIDDNRFDDIYEDDNKDNNSDDKDNIERENKEEVKVGKISDRLIAIDPEKIKEQNFKEEDGIKRAIAVLIEEKNKRDSNIKQILDLGDPKKSHKFEDKNKFNIGKIKKLKIKQLYDKSRFLANQLFIKLNRAGKVKFFDTLVIILLDPSVYISEEIKALYMFIVCAMTNALNCLEMKYSIVLMGDEEFRCVLKAHNEPHSIEALERVYECLMLRRFRTNVPGCLKYCLEKICPKSNSIYTSFFVFTDGLDKRFVYTQKKNWDSNIFNKASNSFGFIFLLSSILTNENKEFLKAIWNTFLTEETNNSRSGIFLESLELKIDEDFKDKISKIFVSNLLRVKNKESSNDFKFNKPVFEIKYENSISFFLNNINMILDDKSLFKLTVSFIKNDIVSSSLNTNKEPLDINHFKNNLHQIAKIINNNNDQSENNIINYSHKFLSIRGNLNRGILEEIFKPNKANLKVLSNTGTEIDIMALILYFLNPVPDPMIYLQDAIGNVKEYAITIIIDTSFSVLNHINISHSLNTIRVLLSSFTIIDLPSFDLIVTGEEKPIVLCSEYPTFAALNEKSKLWELLFQCLSNPISNADLLSALQTAYDLKRMRSNNYPSFLFVLTDGLFEEDIQSQLKEVIAKLVQTNIQVIGIGLGIYPFGITKIFGQAIFDINPINLLHSILSILEGNINENEEMNHIQKEEESEKNILATISKLIQNKKYNFNSLREELKMSPLTINCYDMINDEKYDLDENGRPKPINPVGDKIGLLKENSLSGQKILIVMLWSCALSSTENKLLDPKYIEQTNEKNSKCIKNTVDYLGVKVKTVQNYEDAIKELIQKDSNGKCNYYTVWVMCGPGKGKLPDNSQYPGLVEQFIDCLLLYWENGGSVVLFCDNSPLYYEANIFLEKIRFKGEIKQTNLRIINEDEKHPDPGGQNLIGVDAKGKLEKKSYDTGIIRLPNKTERMPLGRNVPQIYEGETISHANSNNKEDIKPFIPFAKNSSDNICIMIYGTQGKEGDIIIDCGYTKVFINMSTSESSTWRYIQNLAGFLSRPEAHIIYDDGQTAKNYRPNGIDFEIDYSNLYINFEQNNRNKELDIIYMIDSTSSMHSWIKGVKEKCLEILNKLNENPKVKSYDIRFGGVFYRDPVDCPDDKHDYQPLGTVFDLKNKMDIIFPDVKGAHGVVKVKGVYGGGDIPEDWYGAYDLALSEKMGWRESSHKIIIHIADAGAHTLRFSEIDKRHNDLIYENGLVELIKKCAERKINIFGFQIEKYPKQSFSECKAIYDSVGSKECSFEIYPFQHASDEIVAKNLENAITEGISAFIGKK